jgi:nicotinamide-nucleotide amidase
VQQESAVQAIVLSIGAELTSGLTLDAHASAISRALTALGIEVVRHETLDDDAAAIAEALGRAGGQVDLIIATGGLGPTLDDCTREGLAQAMGVELQQNADALAHLDAWAKARGRTAAGSNLVQTMLPCGSTVLANPIGTAVGIEARVGRARVFVMPGVPSEMRLMLAEEVLPKLLAGQGGRVTRVRTLRTFGLGESLVGEKLADLMARGRRPRVGTAVHYGMIDIHIYATGSPEEADVLLAADAATVRARLGAIVFGEGEEEMEHAVASLLAARRRTIALAESCTGGEIASRLVSVPGISDWLLEGIVCYSNESKVRTLGVPADLIRRHGAVSEDVVRAMAEGARARSGASMAVAVTGIAGPAGGSPEKPVGTVWTALCDDRGTIAAREIFTGDRQLVRDRAANYALNMVRLRLMEAEE